MILPRQINLAEVALLVFREEEERERQARVIKARELTEGYFPSALAEKTATYLPGLEAEDIEGINLPEIALKTVIRRLSFSRLTSTPPAEEQIQGAPAEGAGEEEIQQTGDPTTDAFLNLVYEWNNVDVLQKALHKAIERDGEAFVLLEYDEFEEHPDDESIIGKPSIFVHERFTDVQTTWKTFNGDGQGCKAHYKNDDPNQRLEMISHRWIAGVYNQELGRFEDVQRMVLYINEQGHPEESEYLPARIEKYMMDENGEWQQFQEELDEAWPIWWTDNQTETGKSMPIPAVHFRNENMTPGHKAIWGLQAAQDQAFPSLVNGIVMTGNQMLKAFGFHPTTDGKPLAADGSNALTVGPRVIVGTALKGPRDADVDTIDPADIKPILEGIDKLAIFTAFVLGLPVANFMFSRSVASDETLRQGDTELISKVNDLKALFDPQWRAVFRIARKMKIIFGGEGLDENIKIKLVWDIAERREPEYQALEAKALREAGVPEVVIQQRVYGMEEAEARRNLNENVRESERGIGPETNTAVFQAKAQAAAQAEVMERQPQEETKSNNGSAQTNE
jgi:hypothetical protein